MPGRRRQSSSWCRIHAWCRRRLERCAEVGLTDADADYFARMGQQLEAVIVGAANARHVRVADVYVLGQGHGPCADAGNRWVNGNTPAGSGARFHPTAKAHQEMARLVLQALEGND